MTYRAHCAGRRRTPHVKRLRAHARYEGRFTRNARHFDGPLDRFIVLRGLYDGDLVSWEFFRAHRERLRPLILALPFDGAPLS